MRTCPSCSAANSDRARFCESCGTPLVAASDTVGEVRKVVTIVFADMVGSTQMGDGLDPEALRRVQARYFDTMTSAVEAHGGVVEKYIGDAVMAIFGIPRLHEDDALRAARASAAMQDAMDRLNDELERDHGVRIAIRIGVNTGEVVAGDSSSGQRLVTGDTVNVAARLEQAAAASEVLIGASTYRLVRDAVEVERLEPLDLRGKSGPVAAYRLTAVRPDGMGHARHLDSPIVGRKKELDLVRSSLDRVRTERTSYLFTLLGSAGVGKSRLVREFVDGLEGTTVLSGRCLSYGDGITYWALGEIVQQAAGIDPSDDPATALARLTGSLADTDDGARIARLVGGLFGWADPTSADDGSWAVRKLFESLARERPIVVVVDDIQWAEPLFLDLIESLADWMRDAMLLVLCVARTELLEIRPGWGGGKVNATTILLEPLAADEAGDLLDNLLRGTDVPTIARKRILDAAEGNPLFVEEMLAMLIDDGRLREEDEGWRAVSDLTDLVVPPTIQLLLAARLDRLEADERAVLERGAIEGTVFHSGAIAALAPEGLRAQVRPRLLALARKELIRPDRAEFTGEDAFRFRHMLIRDAAYQALPKEQRADLHERFADWLTRVAGDRMGVHEEILGYHLDQAYRYRSELGRIDETTRDLGRRAGRALRASAERALARGDHHTMARLLERAIALLDGYEHAAAQVELGEGLALNDVELPAMVVLRAFLATDAATEWPALGIRARVFLSFTESSTDPTLSQVRMEQHLGSLLAEAEALGDDQAIVACLLGVGQVASWLGETRRQREISERLLARLDDVGIGYRGWVAAGFRTEAYWGATPVDEAFAEVETARRIVGDNVVHGLVCDAIVIGLLVMADRQADATLALERYRRSVAEFPDGIPLSMAQILAEALWRLGRPTEAIDELRLDNERRTARGETGINSTTTGRLAHYLAESGEIEAATATLDDARAMSAADDIATLMEIAWTTAILARMRGDLDAAIGAIDEAIDILRPTDALNHLAEILELRGHILASAGERAQAAATLDEAMTLFERKGNVLGARLLREWRAAH